MTVEIQARPMRTLTWVGLAVTLAMSIPVVGAGAADAEESTLCDAITIDELHALGPLRFATPEASGPALCAFVPADASDAYSLYLALSGISFDQMRQAAEATDGLVEITVGDRPAIVIDGDLHVGLDEGILSVGVQPDDAGGIDPVEFLVVVAEIVVPALAAVPEDGANGELAMAPPPEVDGIEWTRPNLSDGQDLMQDEAQATLWQPLLDATGAETSQLALLNARASNDAEERLGQYDAIRVAGSDPDAFRSALIEWLRAVGGEDAAFEDLSLGGKDVVGFSVGGELAGYLYFEGDTAHAVTLPEELAARVLEALP